MSMSVKIKMLMAARELTTADLARRLDISPQNLSQKLGRDNFKESDLQLIAKRCNATFEGNFILNDTGKTI